MPEKVRVGVVGCGAISGHYLSAAKSFPILEIAACADMNPEAAKKMTARKPHQWGGIWLGVVIRK